MTSRDGGVLFDLEHDRLLKLNVVGVEMWTALIGGATEAQVTAAIAQRYGVAPAQVTHDLRDLLRRAAELGLVPARTLLAATGDGFPAPPSKPSFPCYGQDAAFRPVPRSSVVAAAFLGLALFDLVLKLQSLRGLVSWVRAWPVKNCPARTDQIAPLCSGVDRACVCYPKKALCLQRSAVTTCILRSRGIAARMVVGVRPMPFAAHAWVEVEGAVINDWPLVKKFYNLLTTC